MPIPVTVYTDPEKLFEVSTFGRMPPAEDDAGTAATCIQHTGSTTRNCAILCPAAKPESRGFRDIAETPEGGTDVHADAVMLTPQCPAVLVPTRDCPTITFAGTNRQGKLALVVAHCGRPALTPRQPGGQDTFLHDILNLLVEHYGVTRHQIRAHVSCCIGRKYFRHDTLEAQKMIEPFLAIPGAIVNQSLGTLDLRRCIQQILYECGVDPRRITSDDLCTFSNEQLASLRGSTCNNISDGRNLIVVSR